MNDEVFCVSLAPVKEIIRAPNIVKMPQSEQNVLGLSNLRGQVLPIISLRNIFGFDDRPYDDFTRALIMIIGGRKVGFIVDHVINVFEAQASDIKSIDDFSKSYDLDLVTGVFNNDNNLAMIVDHNKLLANHDGQIGSNDMQEEIIDQVKTEDDTQLVVFRLGEEEFGIEVNTVQEIVRVPESLTHVPKTPSFVEGIVNLRGVVLPVINQRTQFGMSSQDRNDRQRIIVYVINGLKTGFIVDSVTEVMSLPRSSIQPSPSISTDDVIRGIVNMQDKKRIIMII
jgi:purine-binding chemotaxis protein CheW